MLLQDYFLFSRVRVKAGDRFLKLSRNYCASERNNIPVYEDNLRKNQVNDMNTGGVFNEWYLTGFCSQKCFNDSQRN